MKIAIKGDESRGKEIIKILESLGGVNSYNHVGNNCCCYYEIHGNVIVCACTKSDNYKYYTLEEFEKEFPFKVGDKVIHKEFNDFFEVISFDPESSYPYKIKGVCEFNTKSRVLTKWYPKMKEERFVTLTLDKAKEWYKKGGELREIALQAFTEKELNSLPRNWEEFSEKYCIKKGEAYINSEGKILTFTCNTAKRVWDNILPSQKSAEAHLVMIQLEQLRDCWRQGWEPTWDISEKWCIRLWGNELSIGIATNISRFLTFPTKEMAEEFLECFKDLIEKAGDLI